MILHKILIGIVSIHLKGNLKYSIENQTPVKKGCLSFSSLESFKADVNDRQTLKQDIENNRPVQ